MGFFKKRTKDDVASKEIISFGDKKNGKPAKSGVFVKFKDGTNVTLLTPSGRAKKFANELKTNVACDNSGCIKRDEYDMPVELTKAQRAYRGGYLDAMKDSAKAYNAKAKAKKNK